MYMRFHKYKIEIKLKCFKSLGGRNSSCYNNIYNCILFTMFTHMHTGSINHVILQVVVSFLNIGAYIVFFTHTCMYI